tara:strand:+ start:308 stop:733 length:426 start_codon:yes stop_codon:yes gene_type:complete
MSTGREQGGGQCDEAVDIGCCEEVEEEEEEEEEEDEEDEDPDDFSPLLCLLPEIRSTIPPSFTSTLALPALPFPFPLLLRALSHPISAASSLFSPLPCRFDCNCTIRCSCTMFPPSPSLTSGHTNLMEGMLLGSKQGTRLC